MTARTSDFDKPTLDDETSAVLLAVERWHSARGLKIPAWKETLAWLDCFRAAGYERKDAPPCSRCAA